MEKKHNKRLSINKIANIYNDRSRACNTCIFNKCKHYIFIDIKRYNVTDICKQCNKSFVEGFTKGVKHERKVLTKYYYESNRTKSRTY